ncbi:DUF4232 domain-containing protein [Streptomyces paludis]|uniref:DUF4232 domain-containing protein n=1 Tax=Streptomyces paludis TaxID=2282738 RepID=A0A345I0W2_9ACTN|nr:DUF4232 domain-containing protein [Streptomyces paludis]
MNGALGQDELALRRLMHGAVGELKPSEGALDHLRKAVPTRRARKRQAVVGMAAAALLCGTAVPAFIHVANSTSTADQKSAVAGHGEQAQGGMGTDKGAEGGKKDVDRPSDRVSAAEDDDPSKAPKPSGKASSPSGGGGGTGGSGSGSGSGSGTDKNYQTVPASTTCGSSQLTASGQGGAPDAMGKVYGTFRVTNISGTSCTVTGGGTVNFSTAGAADGSRIGVVTHMPGDAASGLPDPSLAVASLVLTPNGAYEVKFAWVPSDTCPTAGPSPDPSPSEDASAGTSSGTGTSTGTGQDGGSVVDPQLGGEDGTQDGSVSVLFVASGGSPTASATISNACAGTVYKTGLLSAT